MNIKALLSGLLFIIVLPLLNKAAAQEKTDSLFPVRGFCIASPNHGQVSRFVKFIKEELVPRKINHLILRVDYRYEYKSRPELRDNNPLTNEEVKQIVKACKEGGIAIIPQINLLGHQSWATTESNLLRKYPQFDETPHVKMPETYKWPNADSLYCKSYCPLHPDVHGIVFPMVDEICDAFEADAFHAGMDEVFYIGDSRCPRCKGKNKAELFAGEVNKIRDHLAKKNRKLWIWGDRLIDGHSTGIGMWEASFNNTYPAIDMIPKDVMICDWHYERADQTAVYFAMKGFDVATCPWRTPELAVQQTADMHRFRATATKVMKDRFRGMIQTVWSDAESFLDGFYKNSLDQKGENKTAWHTFKAIFPK